MNNIVKKNILKRLSKQSVLTNIDEFSINVKELKDLEKVAAIKVVWTEQGKPICIARGINFAYHNK